MEFVGANVGGDVAEFVAYDSALTETTGSRSVAIVVKENKKGNELLGQFTLQAWAGSLSVTSLLNYYIIPSELEAQLELLTGAIGDVEVSRSQSVAQSEVNAFTWTVTFLSNVHLSLIHI